MIHTVHSQIYRMPPAALGSPGTGKRRSSGGLCWKKWGLIVTALAAAVFILLSASYKTFEKHRLSSAESRGLGTVQASVWLLPPCFCREQPKSTKLQLACCCTCSYVYLAFHCAYLSLPTYHCVSPVRCQHFVVLYNSPCRSPWALTLVMDLPCTTSRVRL